jgi:aryl-alcohol dehydrogenase-like predicted oxidoreductase
MDAMKHKNINLVLGAAQIGMPYGISGRSLLDDPMDILALAKKSGSRTIDTAQDYGKSEKLMGAYLRNEEDWQPSLITKFQIESDSLTGLDDELSSKMKKSMDALGREHIFGVMIHNFNALTRFKAELIDRLMKYKKQGRIEKIGASIYSEEELDKAISFSDIELLQGPVNLLNASLRRGGLIKKAKDKGKIFFARSIYLQGLLFLRNDQISQKLPDARPFLDKLSAIAEECERTLAELAFTYVRGQQAVENIVVGVKSVDQLKINLELLRVPPLSDGVIDRINKIADDVPAKIADPRQW